MTFDKKIKFSKDFPHYLKFHIVETESEALRIAEESENFFDSAFKALSSYNHSRPKYKADVVIIKKHLSLHLIVHELNHAVLDWAKDVAMPAAQGGLKTEKETFDYFQELTSCSIEDVTKQTFKVLREYLKSKKVKSKKSLFRYFENLVKK